MFTSEFRIQGRPIGKGHPCYLIGEAGSNHNGDFENAIALIDAAAEAGCDAVKFQVFRPEELVTRGGPQPRYLEGLLAGKGSLFDLFAATAIDRGWLPRLAARCRERRIHFLATPFDLDALDRLRSPEVDMPAVKIASAELWHPALLRHAARSGVPTLLSTGMATLGDVEAALEAIADAGGREIALLHCTVKYPAPPPAVNLAALKTLRRAFGVPVGLSDHTLGIWAPIAAVAMGADLIEKHFTLSRALPGPDHPFALEPKELAQMVEGVRSAEMARGDGRKRRQACEEDIYSVGRRNIVVVRAMRAGDRITQGDLAILRSGLGIDPVDLPKVVGRTVARELAPGAPVQWSDLEGFSS